MSAPPHSCPEPNIFWICLENFNKFDIHHSIYTVTSDNGFISGECSIATVIWYFTIWWKQYQENLRRYTLYGFNVLINKNIVTTKCSFHKCIKSGSYNLMDVQYLCPLYIGWYGVVHNNYHYDSITGCSRKKLYTFITLNFRSLLNIYASFKDFHFGHGWTVCRHNSLMF